uniref:Uncharacterized protein n=1 Tax=Anguilla anguilla TaxID=7936 RepID=A0A0E9QJU4_ANGAN
MQHESTKWKENREHLNPTMQLEQKAGFRVGLHTARACLLQEGFVFKCKNLINKWAAINRLTVGL